MSVKIDLKGERFGRLVVLEENGRQSKQILWKCKCDCDNEVTVISNNLRRGFTKSCGCLNNEERAKRKFKHGKRYHKHYHTWKDMITRCYNSNSVAFEFYGAKGTTVCEEWRDDPTAFLSWCETQEPILEGYTLDRINTYGHYCPENCRFASKGEQSRNTKRNITIERNGEKLCLKDFVEKYGVVSYRTVVSRVFRGMNPEEAALTPEMKTGRKGTGRVDPRVRTGPEGLA